MPPLAGEAVATLEAVLTEAVRASLGLVPDERPAFIANYLLATLEGAEKPCRHESRALERGSQRD